MAAAGALGQGSGSWQHGRGAQATNPGNGSYWNACMHTGRGRVREANHATSPQMMWFVSLNERHGVRICVRVAVRPGGEAIESTP